MEHDAKSIRHEAQMRSELADDIDAIHRKAQAIYPGAEVEIIVRTPSGPLIDFTTEGVWKSDAELPFEKDNYLRQIVRVMWDTTDALNPITLEDLLSTMHERGSDISNETLVSYLSKNKTVFRRVCRGVWQLQPSA